MRRGEYLVQKSQSHPGFLPSIRSQPTQTSPKTKHRPSGSSSKGGNEELERLQQRTNEESEIPRQDGLHADTDADCTKCIWEVPS